jgi:anaerobic magnesium-protoporphyrin IX monomethyl ester cyclase
VWGQRYSTRSPENVVGELQWLIDRHRPDHIWFADDIIGLQPGWLPRFAELVERAGVRIPFKCLSRADLLTRNGEVEALHRAGCQIVWLGAESGSQRVLDAMEKGIRVEQVVEASRRLHTTGIQVGFFLQFGYPGETLDDIERTFSLVRECQPDDIGVSVSYPLPGTVFYDRVKATLGERQNWVDSSDLAMLYRGPFTTAFYRQLHRVLHKEFRARRAWRQLRAKIGRPSTLKARDLGRTAAALGHAVTLPYARHRLDRLSRVPHEGIGALPYELSREQAGKPTGTESIED